MDIALVRVDNRLVHGQILEAWVPYVRANCIIVVDDHVASDFFRETVIKMAVPRDIEVIIAGVEDFSKIFSVDDNPDKRTIVLFSDVSDVVESCRQGFRFECLNIGNIHNENCIKECSPSVLLGTKDIQNIETLLKAGIKIKLQRVPRENPTDIQEILQSLKSDGIVKNHKS